MSEDEASPAGGGDEGPTQGGGGGGGGGWPRGARRLERHRVAQRAPGRLSSPRHRHPRFCLRSSGTERTPIPSSSLLPPSSPSCPSRPWLHAGGGGGGKGGGGTRSGTGGHGGYPPSDAAWAEPRPIPTRCCHLHPGGMGSCPGDPGTPLRWQGGRASATGRRGRRTPRSPPARHSPSPPAAPRIPAVPQARQRIQPRHRRPAAATGAGWQWQRVRAPPGAGVHPLRSGEEV